MGLINKIAGIAGESLRIHRTANQEEIMDPSLKKKFELMQADAQNGNPNAMFRLGSLYFQGKDVGYNPDKACEWWTKAAKKGNVDAQYNLGLLYNGKLSEFYYDENLAGYWFYLASKSGDKDALEMLQYYRYDKLSKRWYRK